MATYADLIIEQGTSFSADIAITNEGIDLAEYNVYGQMRKTYTSSDAIDFTTAIVDATNFQISLTPAQTETVKSGRYVYDVEIHRISDGFVYRVVEGGVNVTPGVTRSGS